ncbi:MAG: DUF6498-containing protein, partial [Planctomycetota bacterium]
WVKWNISARDLCDPSVLALVASNAAVIIWALMERWQLTFVMCVYCAQSLVIGLFWAFTIFTYGKIYRKDRESGAQRWTLSPAEKDTTAAVFAAHYLLLHVLYIRTIILGVLATPHYPKQEFPIKPLLTLSGVFFVSRLFGFLREKRENSNRQANAMKLMFFPYARIVPMHAAMVLGGSLEISELTSQSALFFFLLLKTAADVFMHIVEKKGFDEPSEGSGPA